MLLENIYFEFGMFSFFNALLTAPTAVLVLSTNTLAHFVPSNVFFFLFQEGMWERLNRGAPWWEADNGSYIYLNRGDGRWWLDSGETGLGLYVAPSREGDEGVAPPQQGWQALGDGKLPLPTLTTEA